MSLQSRIEALFHVQEPSEEMIRDVVADLIEYCRARGIRFERVIIDAVLERSK